MIDNDVQKGLERDAREVAEHIPQKLTEAEIQRVAESFKKFLAENDFSIAEVARLLGYSRTAISGFISGHYKGDIEKIANKVVNFMNSVFRKNKRAKNEVFIQTGVAKKIGTLITQTEAFCDDEGKIGLIIGDGGHGKSYCLKQYSKSNKNTVYVAIDQTMSSTKIFAEIAKGLEIDALGSLPAITERLISTLKERHIIIIIDEASDLKVRQLDQLRQIVVVKSKCPLILSGNSDLLKTVMQPSTKRGYESLDQFTSRLMAILNLDELAGDKDGGLYTVEDVRRLYEYGGIKLTTGAVDALKRICMTPKSGRLRTCSHIIAALHTCKVVFDKGFIDVSMITAAIEQLDLPVKLRLPISNPILGMAIDSDNDKIMAAAG